ncbi:hypothetical protein PoB_005587200 [Plakobranchus ocellatus]|uniref:Uncharacterized protein n=1 Tax=Plakobranchus ocellatus TaxID=259542 RepID=A0AAV4CCU3_9GAST|nr:hypothetical protein PoB_005587200 [Plakobranchus ocellatus]
MWRTLSTVSAPLQSITLEMCLYHASSSPFFKLASPPAAGGGLLGLQKAVSRFEDTRCKTDSEDSEPVNWINIMEVKVTKDYPSTSHFDATYKSLTLKRQQADIKKFPLMRLNSGPVKIPPAKYEDLISLCTGPTALVRASNHKAFYMSLPH